MTQDAFKRFIQLIEFDQSLQSVEKDLVLVQAELVKIKKELEVLTADYQHAKIHVHDLRKQVDQEELMMRTYDEEERVSRTRLDAANSPKHYQALKKENDTHKQTQHAHEQVLMNVWNTFEVGQKQLQATQDTFDQKKQELEKELDLQEKRMAELMQNIKEHEKERQTYLQDIPEEWMAKYNRMKNTVKNPVVGIVAGTCGGCSFLLSNQLVLALGQNRLMQCTSCYRLLYKHFDQNPAA